MARIALAVALLAATVLPASAQFVIQSETDPDKFSMRIRGYFQFRYTFNVRDETESQEQITNGFDNRRTKVGVAGNVLSADTTYLVVMAVNKRTGLGFLEDAWVNYEFGDTNWSVTAGQFKPPFRREELVSASRQIAVDRSVANEVFNQDYTQGVRLAYNDSQTRFQVAFTDGFRTLNDGFTNRNEADLAITGRVEHAMGDSLRRFRDFTSWRSAEETAVLVGVAGHWQTSGHTFAAPLPAPERDQYFLTADLSLEGQGWSAFSAVVMRTTDPDEGGEVTDFGVVAQGSLFVTDQTELFIRGSAIFPDDNHDIGGTDEFYSMTVGGTRYFIPESHAAKLVTEVIYYPEPKDDSDAIIGFRDNAGLLPDTEGNQFVIRAMMQVMF